jgi:UDP-glucose:(heptosyl)LPS alpha-1,3-glucosyltransferase
LKRKLNIAFCLFAYRPFGGLQRDFFHIASRCVERGHTVHVFTMEWRGEVPEGFHVHVVPIRSTWNHARSREFGRAVAREVSRHHFDVVFGFNRIPGLDIYFAADPCYEAKIRRLHGFWYRFTPRYREFARAARAIFAPESHTRILLLTDKHISEYVQFHKTPLDRFTVLPPGISPDRRAPEDRQQIRKAFRAEYGLGDADRVILLVGSGFRTKGLDRAIRALAALPAVLGRRSRLLVVGEDKERPFRRLARRLGVADRVQFMQGREDVQRFMLGADLLIHPAYSENTGIVLIEAVISGLPVLVTDVCGHAEHVERAQAGRVLASPFSQAELNRALAGMLDSPERIRWSENGIRYGLEHDLYSMPEVVVDCIEEYAEAADAGA